MNKKQISVFNFKNENLRWIPANYDWVRLGKDVQVLPLFPPINKLFLILKTLNLSLVYDLKGRIPDFILKLIFQLGMKISNLSHEFLSI